MSSPTASRKRFAFRLHHSRKLLSLIAGILLPLSPAVTQEPQPPIQCFLRVIDEPVLRLVSVDLATQADITSLSNWLSPLRFPFDQPDRMVAPCRGSRMTGSK